MSMRHQTGGGHKQQLNVQNAKPCEGYSTLIPRPDKSELIFKGNDETISALMNQEMRLKCMLMKLKIFYTLLLH